MVSSASPPLLGSLPSSAAFALPPRTEKRLGWSRGRRKPTIRVGQGSRVVRAMRSNCTAFPPGAIPMILLIGNYPADRQQSMQRFASVMIDGLTAAGIEAEVIQPVAFFGRFRFAGGFVAKWM